MVATGVRGVVLFDSIANPTVSYTWR